MTKQYLLMWDCYGLESVIDINKINQEMTWAALQDKLNSRPVSVNKLISLFTVRARANPQRYYEIYIVDTTEDISADDLTNMFNDEPQIAADLIRQRGQKLYSDRKPNDSRVKIT